MSALQSQAPCIPQWGLRADNPAPALPFGKPEAPAVNLTEKYRPALLADVRGQGDIVYQLTEFLGAPVSAAFVFSGETGTGKTSAALAFARELGAVEFGGLHQIKSGAMDAEAVEGVFAALRLVPMRVPGSSGWHCVIVDEADTMSDKARKLWLSILEDLGPQTIIIFTTNHLEKFERRFLDRCECHVFRSDAETLTQDAQDRINQIWLEETGRTDAPTVESIPGAIREGKLSFRAAVQGLNPLLRTARPRPKLAATPAPEIKPVETVAPEAPRKTAKTVQTPHGVFPVAAAPVVVAPVPAPPVSRPTSLPRALRDRTNRLGVLDRRLGRRKAQLARRLERVTDPGNKVAIAEYQRCMATLDARHHRIIAALMVANAPVVVPTPAPEPVQAPRPVSVPYGDFRKSKVQRNAMWK